MTRCCYFGGVRLGVGVGRGVGHGVGPGFGVGIFGGFGHGVGGGIGLGGLGECNVPHNPIKSYNGDSLGGVEFVAAD